jgi:RNA recognition motif-containing protein
MVGLMFSVVPIVMLAAFSLAWFLTGVVAGASMVRERAGRSGPAARKGGRKERIEIYVGNLSYDMTRQDVMKLFGGYGEVASARVIKNRFNGKSKGYGFLEMTSRPEATEAIRALSGKEYKGRKMVVNEAKSNQRAGNNRTRGE